MASRSFGGAFGSRVAEVARTFAALARSIPERLDKEMLDEAEKLRNEASAKASAIPTRGGRSTGLRQKVASGVSVIKTQDGVDITTSMPDATLAGLPRGLDSSKGWRHPVFGNRNVLVTQQSGAPGWFTETMQSAQPELQEKFEAALEDEADKHHA